LRQSLLKDKHDSKAFWSTIRKVKGRKNIKPQIAIEEWEKHFKRILGRRAEDTCTNVNRNHESESEDVNDVYVPELDAAITLNEVKKCNM
jgi:hypothetical protein